MYEYCMFLTGCGPDTVRATHCNSSAKAFEFLGKLAQCVSGNSYLLVTGPGRCLTSRDLWQHTNAFFYRTELLRNAHMFCIAISFPDMLYNYFDIFSIIIVRDVTFSFAYWQRINANGGAPNDLYSWKKKEKIMVTTIWF
jgi:hypothetical protein